MMESTAIIVGWEGWDIKGEQLKGQVWMTGYLETRTNHRIEYARIWETKRGTKTEAVEWEQSCNSWIYSQVERYYKSRIEICLARAATEIKQYKCKLCWKPFLSLVTQRFLLHHFRFFKVPVLMWLKSFLSPTKSFYLNPWPHRLLSSPGCYTMSVDYEEDAWTTGDIFFSACWYCVPFA